MTRVAIHPGFPGFVLIKKASGRGFICRPGLKISSLGPRDTRATPPSTDSLDSPSPSPPIVVNKKLINDILNCFLLYYRRKHTNVSWHVVTRQKHIGFIHLIWLGTHLYVVSCRVVCPKCMKPICFWRVTIQHDTLVCFRLKLTKNRWPVMTNNLSGF